MNRKRENGKQAPEPPTSAATWIARICFAAPFAWNLQCIFSLLTDPAAAAAGFQLQGTAGAAAVQGLAIAFLMWNATYPLFIFSPARFRTLGIIVAIQQAIGLVGETALLLSLPVGYPLLTSSIERFIAFDGAGLALMIASLAYLFFSCAHLVHRR